MKKKNKILLVAVLTMAILCVCIGLVYFGVIQFNNPSRGEYPVRGVDVSSYQGEIDWAVLSAQDIQFAFIKATEGSGHVDAYFQSNFKNAQKTQLRVGAYHFFSFDSGGDTQAQNFIAAVPKTKNMLPPVVDFEFYGDKEKNLPDKEAAQRELTVLLETLEAHYGMKPVIYVTEKSYRLYIDGAFADYDLWVRNVLTKPALSDGRAWTFWQYTDRERLDGYVGKETYIDMNVFRGSEEGFKQYAG